MVRGGASDLASSGNRAYDLDSAGFPGVRGAGNAFGAAVSLADHDRDGRLDLAVGAPGKYTGSGALTTVRGAAGTAGGFGSAGGRTVGLEALGASDVERAGFGSSFARP